MTVEVLREEWWNLRDHKAELRNDFVDLFASRPCAYTALNRLLEVAVEFDRVDQIMTARGLSLDEGKQLK
jgi:hypothetical protein